MEHSYIDENNIADLYLMERLSEAERERFELHFLDCPRCTELLETTQDIREALQMIGPPPAAAPGATVAPRFPVQPNPLGSSRPAALLAAAFLIMILPFILLLIEAGRLRGELNRTQADLDRASAALKDRGEGDLHQEKPAAAQPTPGKSIDEKAGQARPSRPAAGNSKKQLAQINTPVFVFSTQRHISPTSAGSSNQIVIERSNQWFVISLELEGDPDFENYRAVIFDASGRQKWQSRHLKPNSYNSLTIGFSSNFLKSGEYTMTLEGVRNGSSRTIANYPFTIIQKQVK